ncbi:MAG: hypothetical protein HFH10_10470 [Dorea sp.]|nr:hypothetical protein [Dorea sp.]
MDIGTTGILSLLFNNMVNDGNTITESVTADNSFNDFYKETAIENVKADIYNKFNIKVNVFDSKTECTIPRDVLYQMNSDAALREKIYTVLADYKKTKSMLAGFNPPVKKYTLAFDEQGNVLAYILEPDMEKLEEDFGKSKNKNCIVNRSSLETYSYNEIINNFLNGSFQGFEIQQAMIAAQFLQRPKINLTD